MNADGPTEEPPWAAEDRKRAKRVHDDLKQHRDWIVLRFAFIVFVVVVLAMFFKGVFTGKGTQAPEVIKEIVPKELE